MKLKCEAPCQTCYYSNGRRQDFHENDLIWFCRRCTKFFFCEIGLVRGYNPTGGMSYSCPYCASTLDREEVDKIIIAKNLTPIGRTSKDSHDIYHKLMSSSRGKKKASKTTTETLTAYEHSQISELGDIKGLKRELILEVAQMYEIDKLKNFHKIKSVPKLLTDLAKANTKIIPFLYSALFKFQEDFRSFQLRFAIFCYSSMPEIKEVLLVNPEHERIYDIKLTVSKKNNEIWVFCSEKDIDVNNLNTIVQKAFSVDFKDYPKLKRIFLAAPSFSYIASSTIKKYQSVLSGIDEDEATFVESNMKWRSIPISLWKSEPYKLEFKKLIIE